MRADEVEDAVRKEWKFTARVIDRFCLVLFSIDAVRKEGNFTARVINRFCLVLFIIVTFINTFGMFFFAPKII
ncbi:unnamed protein product [Dibothriocephalus latus]|uniref:Ion transport domain-containing protein n=1 Tax=Dibothriocephalus latus TaxID=60516 RepID=A0A3P7NKD1_DIBLA|nr:unnamed protein product [Dibothriocephalus latus]